MMISLKEIVKCFKTSIQYALLASDQHKIFCKCVGQNGSPHF